MPQEPTPAPSYGAKGAEHAERPTKAHRRSQRRSGPFAKRSGNATKPERQFRYADDRKWTADFCYPAARLLIEVQGGVWSGGRHTRGAGYERDRVKYFEAQLRGWRVIEVTPAMIADGRALSLIERALKGAD
jgi:very-short-patch-repair endonuclease